MQLDNNYSYLFKFIIIGDASTGKTCILHQFIENRFKQITPHTIGVEFGSRVLSIGGKQIKLQIWDTAGQERFRSITRFYYRGAVAALLVYDITNRGSYNSIQKWLAEVRSLTGSKIVIILVGNKKDLVSEREVRYLEARQFAQENELTFLETSALSGENISETFYTCARAILARIDSGEIDVGNWFSRENSLFEKRKKFQTSCSAICSSS